MEVQEHRQSDAGSAASTSSDDLFIRHKVNKLDTLAGLAIRYNVSVADIRRANGLLSDTAMFARDTLLIPKHCLPVGEEVQMMFAQLVSGLGRDPCLNKEATLFPGTAAVVRLAGPGGDQGVDTGQDIMPSSFSCSKWWCYCGECTGMFHPSTCDGDHSYQTMGREVEMSDISGAGYQYVPPGNDGPTRLAENVRRRRKEGDGPPYGAEADLQRRTAPPTFKNGRAPQRPVDSTSIFQQLSNLSKTIGESDFIQKIKRAATQPALATAHTTSLRDAADGVLVSLQAPSKSSMNGAGVLAQSRAAPMSPLKPKINGKHE